MRAWDKRIQFLSLAFVMVMLSIGCSTLQGQFPSASPSVSSEMGSSGGAVRELNLALGTNLSGIADWETQMPFLDAFKSSRKWITHCVAGEAGCQGTWDTNEFDQLDLDEQGWVRSLPAPDDAPEYTRVGTLMFRSIGNYPGGKYVVLYEGEGTIEYQFDAVKDEALSAPGRDVIDVTPSDDGIYLVITSTDPQMTGNYIRNIHVVPMEYETTFATEIFNPMFIDRIQAFKALRFMDWMATNNSQQGNWEDRPEVDDASYAWKGVPVEVMIDLANRLGADAWFCMPHLATDEYMREFAQIVKSRLDPQLNVLVEFSNEVWNWQFQQAQYALEQGKARWGEQHGDAHMQWYGMRAAQMSDIWNEVFGDQRDRLSTVISTQTAWRGLETSALDCPLWVDEGNAPCYQHGFNAYAITAYFSGNLYQAENVSAVESWLDDGFEAASDKAFEQMANGNLLQAHGDDSTLPGVMQLLDYHAEVARDRQLNLVVYEGGQHLVSSENQKLTDFFMELNRQPPMYELYTTLLNGWKSHSGTLFMNFTDITNPSRWGSWGALEHVNQERSPKYDALMDFIQDNS